MPLCACMYKPHVLLTRETRVVIHNTVSGQCLDILVQYAARGQSLITFRSGQPVTHRCMYVCITVHMLSERERERERERTPKTFACSMNAGQEVKKKSSYCVA